MTAGPVDEPVGSDPDDRPWTAALHRLPSRRVRLVTALFGDVDSAITTARALADRGYGRERVTVIVSPPPRCGRDFALRPRFGGPELSDPAATSVHDGGPLGETRSLEELAEDAYLIVGVEAATDAERTALEKDLADLGGRLIQTAAVPAEDGAGVVPRGSGPPAPGVPPEDG